MNNELGAILFRNSTGPQMMDELREAYNTMGGYDGGKDQSLALQARLFHKDR